MIRQELAGGRTDREVGGPADGRAGRRSNVTVRDTGALYSIEDVVDETGAGLRQLPTGDITNAPAWGDR